jgi:hypothetical protein
MMMGREFMNLNEEYGYELMPENNAGVEDPNQLAMSQSDIYLMFGTNQ